MRINSGNVKWSNVHLLKPSQSTVFMQALPGGQPFAKKDAKEDSQINLSSKAIAIILAEKIKQASPK